MSRESIDMVDLELQRRERDREADAWRRVAEDFAEITAESKACEVAAIGLADARLFTSKTSGRRGLIDASSIVHELSKYSDASSDNKEAVDCLLACIRENKELPECPAMSKDLQRDLAFWLGVKFTTASFNSRVERIHRVEDLAGLCPLLEFSELASVRRYRR